MNPIPDWLRNYRASWLAGDAVAGLIVTVMLIPQSLAYALLAALPVLAKQPLLKLVTQLLIQRLNTVITRPCLFSACLLFQLERSILRPGSAILDPVLHLHAGFRVILGDDISQSNLPRCPDLIF